MPRADLRWMNVKLLSVRKRNDQGPKQENEAKCVARVSPGESENKSRSFHLVCDFAQTPELFFLGQKSRLGRKKLATQNSGEREKQLHATLWKRPAQPEPAPETHDLHAGETLSRLN